MQRVILPLAAVVLVIGASGCKMMDKVTGVEDLEAEKSRLQAKLNEIEQERQKLRQQLNSAESEAESLQTRLSDAEQERDRLQEMVSEEEARREKLAEQRRELQELVKDLSGISVESRGDANAIVLEDKILFALGEAALGDQARQSLNKIAQYLKEKQWQRIRIEGHTDGVPVTSDRWEDNYHLSAMRAHAVMSYLVSKGLEPGKMYLAGFGPNRPVVEPDEKTDPVAENRRVELLLVPPRGEIGSYLQEFD